MALQWGCGTMWHYVVLHWDCCATLGVALCSAEHIPNIPEVRKVLHNTTSEANKPLLSMFTSRGVNYRGCATRMGRPFGPNGIRMVVISVISGSELLDRDFGIWCTVSAVHPYPQTPRPQPPGT